MVATFGAPGPKEVVGHEVDVVEIRGGYLEVDELEDGASCGQSGRENKAFLR